MYSKTGVLLKIDNNRHKIITQAKVVAFSNSQLFGAVCEIKFSCEKDFDRVKHHAYSQRHIANARLKLEP